MFVLYGANSHNSLAKISNIYDCECCSVSLTSRGRSLNPRGGSAAIGSLCVQATHYLLSTLLRKIDGNDGKDRTQAHLAETPQEIFSFCTN